MRDLTYRFRLASEVPIDLGLKLVLEETIICEDRLLSSFASNSNVFRQI